MTPARFQLRAIAGLGLLLIAFAALVFRLAQVQLGDTTRWTRAAVDQQLRTDRRIPAERGAITDREGRALARTEWLPTIALDPYFAAECGTQNAIVETLYANAGHAVAKQAASLLREASPERRYVRLIEKWTDSAAAERVADAVTSGAAKGLIVEHEPVRSYPSGSLASHIVGFLYESEDGSRVGAEGVECLAERVLCGTPGRRLVERDGRGRLLELGDHAVTEPVPGRSVALTVDAVIQAFAEQALDDVVADHHPKSAVAAVVDVWTGELLAVACRPTFEPTSIGGSELASRRNRFFTDVFVPGSTFKPLAMAIALDEGVVRTNEIIDCNPGTVRVARRTIREDKHKNLGELTPTGIIARSSNVGMAKLALRIGIPAMQDGVERLGFGQRSAIRWPAESGGLVTPAEKWTEAYTLCSVSFGQEIAVTPAQLLTSYATLANGGVHRPLRILRDAEVDEPVRVLRQEAALALHPMMEATLLHGTARNAALSDYRVAGKTGTAEKRDRQNRTYGYVGSFACFGPVDAPRLAVLVVADEPEGKAYGSVVAAPYATDLMRRSLRYLDVPPSPTPPPAVDELLEVMPR